MEIIPLLKLNEYSRKHAETSKHIQAWITMVKNTRWKNPSDVLKDYPTASIIGADRARFKILGNNYRLIVEIDYQDEIVEIRFIGTHDEYDKIDAKSI